MPDLQSKEQRIAVFKRGLAVVDGARVDPAAVDRKGSTLNLLAAGSAALAEDVERRQSAKLAALTLAGAQGDELDALATERTFGEVVRFGASPAVLTLSVARPAGGALAPGTLPAGTQVLAGNIVFVTDTALPFLAGQLGPLTVDATATAAGDVTNVAAGAVDRFQSPGDLFDSTLTVTNPARAAGGGNREEDPDLKIRVAQYPTTVRRGTAPAIEAGAQLVPGVRQAVLVEVVDEIGFPTGQLILYIADANGQANDSLARRVIAGLREYRAGGAVVRVVGSLPTFVVVVLAIGYQSGFDTVTVQAKARAAVVAAINRLAPTATLEVSLIQAALRSVPGTVVPATAVVAPAGDVVPAPGETFRTSLDLVSFA